MWVTAILAAITVVITTLFYRKRKRDHEFFRQLGIPGPEPNWLLGNYRQIAESCPHLQFQKWTKQYGKTYGYFEGSQAIIVTSDSAILKQIFIKNFSSLHGRKMFPIQPNPEGQGVISMFIARGQRWKRLRTIVNPTFSNAKMKQMSGIIVDSVDIFMQRLDELYQKDEALDIYPLFQGLTMHVIGECAFGIQSRAQTDPDDAFLRTVRRFFNQLEQKPLLVKFAAITPELQTCYHILSRGFISAFGSATKKIFGALKKVIDQRKSKIGEGRVDLLQLLLEAEDYDMDSSHGNSDLTMNLEDDKKEITSNENGHNHTDKHKTTKQKLTIGEIEGQSFLFLLAGYETTSNALGYCTYELALNVDVQRRLHDEIIQYLGQDSPTYEKVHNMPYLDMVLSETLRLYPIASTAVNRLVMEECVVGGYTLPPGVVVQADVWSLHRDPDLWGPDPESFNPDRFRSDEKKQRDPMAWMPFGAGPRNCIGMRFALMEAKLTMAKLLQKYQILQCPETEVPLKVKEAGTVSPRNGIKVRLQRR